MHRAIILVGPAGKGEETLDRVRHFLAGGVGAFAGLRLDAGGEFLGAIFEVFGKEIEDLRAVVGGRGAPAERSASRLDGGHPHAHPGRLRHSFQ